LRKQIPTHLESFDFPQMTRIAWNAATRPVGLPQALYLMNKQQWSIDSRGVRPTRVYRDAGAESTRQIERAFWIALSRAATDEEKQSARGVDQTRRYVDDDFGSIAGTDGLLSCRS